MIDPTIQFSILESLIPVPQTIELPFEDGWKQWDLATHLQDALIQSKERKSNDPISPTMCS